MKHIIFLNDSVIDETSTYNDTFENVYGLKNNFLKYFEKRLEMYEKEEFDIEFIKFDKLEWLRFIRLIYNVLDPSENIKEEELNNVYILHHITTYRGWRHIRGLPVRGQRTWSNAWSTYKNNYVLRDFRTEEAKLYYISAPIRESVTAFSAEYVNMFWKIQFMGEWYSGKEGLLKFTGHPSTMKIDLFSMANYQVMFPEKLEGMSKKKKQAQAKNSFSLGFEPGFTQPLMAEKYNIEDLLNTENQYAGSKILLRDERPLKKKKKNSRKLKS